MIDIPSGAKSPLLLSQDARITAFVRAMAAADKLVACICRGALLAAYAGIVQGHRVTGFMGDSQLSADQYRELAVEPVVVHAGGIWENGRVVMDRNFLSSRHPRDLTFFTAALCQHLWPDTTGSPFDAAYSPDSWRWLRGVRHKARRPASKAPHAPAAGRAYRPPTRRHTVEGVIR